MLSGIKRRRAAVGILGAATMLLLHSLLFVVAVWGDGAPLGPRPPERVGAGANLGTAEGGSQERLIIVQLQAEMQQTPQPAEQPVLLEKIRPPSMLAITGSDALPMTPLFPSEKGEASQASEADMIARTQLMGVYEQQIRARIERAWLRPREPVGRQPGNPVQDENHFRCRVLIRQNERGGIREVELQRCNGSERWQRSLTDAIFSSSPLPAPPNAQVFADVFSMQFEALSYSEAQPTELYEQLRTQLTSVVPRNSAPALQPKRTVDQSSAPSNLYLNVTAEKIEWSAMPPPHSSTNQPLAPESTQRVK
jgi:hypothetical protein